MGGPALRAAFGSLSRPTESCKTKGKSRQRRRATSRLSHVFWFQAQVGISARLENMNMNIQDTGQVVAVDRARCSSSKTTTYRLGLPCVATSQKAAWAKVAQDANFPTAGIMTSNKFPLIWARNDAEQQQHSICASDGRARKPIRFDWIGGSLRNLGGSRWRLELVPFEGPPPTTSTGLVSVVVTWRLLRVRGARGQLPVSCWARTALAHVQTSSPFASSEPN